MDIWRHGKYVDTWTIVHILSGILIGIGFFWLGWLVILASVAALLLLVVWEIIELIAGIGENFENVVVDIVTGMAGFALVWYVQAVQGYEISLVSALGIGLGTSALAVWGFANTLKKKHR